MGRNNASCEPTVLYLAEQMLRLQEAVSQSHQTTTARQRGYFSPSEDDQVLHLWVSYHETRSALLEQVCHYQQTPKAPNLLNWPIFAAAYSAALAFVDAARCSRELFAAVPIVRRKLNASFEHYGIGAGSFDATQLLLSDPGRALQLCQTKQFFAQCVTKLRKQAMGKESLSALLTLINRLTGRLEIGFRAYAQLRVPQRSRDLYNKVVFQGVGQAFYAVQSWISRCVGQLSTQSGHQSALPEPIKADLLQLMGPGDVSVTRKEHSLANYISTRVWGSCVALSGRLPFHRSSG